MRIFFWLMVVLLAFPALCLGAEQLPVMKINYLMQETYTANNAAIADPNRLELGVSMGSEQWGFGFAGFETKWTSPLTFEVIGSGNYSSYDIFSMAAITLDYGVGNNYVERHHFGVGVIAETRGLNGPSWGNAGSNNIMHGNLLTANENVQRVTIDPKKYAPKNWNGKLWIGLAIHNAGVGQYVIARIVNAAPEFAAPMSPIFDSVKRLLAGGVMFTPEIINFSAESYNAASKKIPVMLQPYLSIFSLQEAQKAARDYDSADDAGKAKMRVILSQFTLDARGAGNKQLAGNELNKKWNRAGSFGKQFGCIVRQASNLVKVGVQDLSSGRIVGSRNNTIELSAARHEHEGFQLIFTPVSTAPARVSIAATSLKGKRFDIPASNVRVQAVAYTRVFEGKSNQLYQPDPLLQAGKWPLLKAGQNQSYWISVKVPDNAPAGAYIGSIVISAAGQKYSVPLKMQVRNFNIPKQISLRSSFWMFRDQINRYYNLDEVAIDDYMKWIDLALEYRLNPIDVYEGRCTQYLDIVKNDTTNNSSTVNENPDWSKWDKYIDHMLSGGANTIHLGVSHHQGAFFTSPENPVSSPGQIANVEKSIEIAKKHYKERGIYDLHYMQLRDETSEPASLNVYRAVYKDMPDVKTLLTAPSAEARGILRIPCPLTPGYDKAWQQEVVKEGGEYWWYVCVGPSDRRYANLFIDQKAVQHRAWWWQTWHYGVDGLLYWGMNYYKWYGDPLLSKMKAPVDTMPSLDYVDFSPIESAPGDGFSIYPGPTPSQPIPSLRLEIMRDGEEDYEYLIMLDRLIKEKPQAKAVSKAKKAAARAHSMTTGLIDYVLDESEYQKVRNEVASAIEAMLK